MRRISALFFIFLMLMAAQCLQDRYPNWVKVSEHANWQPRDSPGELVFKDQLWILGGWFSSYAAPPNDVWSSPDGKDWSLIEQTAPWKHGDLPMTLVFDNKMWVMGGWHNGRLPDRSASNEVWSSTDGARWEEIAKNAQWSPRLGAGAVVFRGKMWILGGIEDYYFGNTKSLKNDVWSSSDGKNWQLATANAGWSPRAYHAAVVHDGKIWVLGGGNYTPEYQALNDVWCSEDGIHWTKVTEQAGWSPRIWFSSVVYQNRIWVIGGWSNHPYKNWNDVWYSADGKSWKKFTTNRIWKGRHEHSTLVLQDKIWVIGGFPLNNEVWSLSIPEGVLED
ncbi:MAG: galactose oxidase [Pseudomonadota bacterium]